MTRKILAASLLVSAAVFGGSASAQCVARDVCYRNVTIVDECVPNAGGGCKQVRVEAPLCWGGTMWTGGLCWL